MQNTVMKGVTTCMEQYFLPHKPEVQVHFLSEINPSVGADTCWCPLETLGRALGSQLQKAEVIQERWNSVQALKIHTATFLSKGLCS